MLLVLFGTNQQTMDISDSTTGTSDTADIQPRIGREDAEESRCNWDVEIIQFVVESFICMFPAEKKCGLRRKDGRGKKTDFCPEETILQVVRITHSEAISSFF